MTTPWYYEFHEQDTFPYQQQLCDAVRWSDYNLEGQILKSPYVLSPILGNPITIRLLALNEALEKFNYIEEIDNEPRGVFGQVVKRFDIHPFPDPVEAVCIGRLHVGHTSHRDIRIHSGQHGLAPFVIDQ